ncbi:MAG: hypothetical protein LUE14_07355 [Clostridiales bacterium]|nr:hypothetical protein [Clostridiales bacterium]
MALTHEDLQSISQLLEPMRTDIQGLRTDVQGLKSDMETVKADVQGLKSDMETMKQKVTALELTLENVTNRNISILAENHSSLVEKLDGVLNTKNENMIRDVKVSVLTAKVEKLERDVAELKGKTA